MNKHILMPVEPTQEMLSSAMAVCTGFSGDYGRYNDHLSEDAAREVYQAFRSVAPAVQAEPVGWQFYEDGRWWNGDDRIKDHRKNTEAAGVPVRDVYAAPQPTEQREPVASAPVAAQQRFRHLQKSTRDWSPWQSASINLDRPSWEIDSQGYEVEYRLLYDASQPAEQQPAPDVAGLVEALEQGFPLLNDEGLDEVEHHCEWVIQRERKRVHSILAAHRKQGR